MEPSMLPLLRSTEGGTTKFTKSLVPPSPEGVAVIASDTVLLVLATFWTAMRLYSRKLKNLPFMVEDWLHILALVFFYGLVVVSFMMVLLGGMGHHLKELQPFHTIRLLKVSFASQVLYSISLGLVKVSICWMIGRIFIYPSTRIASYIAMGLSFSWAVMTILIGLLICHPVQMNWNQDTPGGKCGNQQAGFAAVGFVDLFVDLFILLLPIPAVLRLQLPRANKIGLLAIFLMGILTMVFGAIRLAAVLRVDFTDFTFTARTAHSWSVAECGVAIIVSSSPLLRPIFDRVFKKFLSVTGSRNRSGRGLKYDRSNRAGSNHRFSRPTTNKNPDGFYPMGDSDVELNGINGNGQARSKVTIEGRRGKSGDDYQDDEGFPHSDDSSGKAIYVTTVISQ